MLTTSASAAEERKFALVIGNSRYQDAPLRNPANDAGAIAGELSHGEATEEKALHMAMVREAAADFRRGTSSVNGLHPRQVSQLSDPALSALACAATFY